MKLPYYNPGHRGLTFSLVLLLALTLLVLTGLGVFRLYFGFDWLAGDNETGQLFNLTVRGGQSFNMFEAESFGRTFWISLLCLALLCVLMPLFRLPGASFLALLTAAGLFYLDLHFNEPEPLIPLEFELFMVVMLYAIYVLLSYMGEVRDRKRIHGLLSQYVPPELAREIQRDPNALKMSGEEREISVLFCDVIGFTAIAEQLDPAELARWLNLFFSHVSRVVVRHRGSIDKYMGDSVMAVWGALARSDTHAFDALRAAMDMQDELDMLNAQFRDSRLPEVSMGIGISTGPAMVGPLGSSYRMDYTVVGDSVNVARRLEALTRKYHVPVIVGDRTAAELPDMVFRELDTVTVKGRTQAVTMYEPLGERDLISDAALERLALHEEAMQASKAGQWDRATELFTVLQEDWGPHSMYELYLRGIQMARQAG